MKVLRTKLNLHMKKRGFLPFIVLLCIVSRITAADSLKTQPVDRLDYSYNINDRLFEAGNYFVFLYDDWGFDGAINYLGLPNNVISIRENRFQVVDPLFGQVPMGWLGTAYSALEFSATGQGLAFQSRFTNDGKIKSRFDYERGDYNFLNFGIFMAGQLSDRVKWNFSGERFGYDGRFGLYTYSQTRTNETLTESYRMNIQNEYERWRLLTSLSYQKYRPGVLETSVSGNYPAWRFSGGKTESRVAVSVCVAQATQTDSLFIGVSLDGFIYRNDNSSFDLDYNGEANRVAVNLAKYFSWQDKTLEILCNPYYQAIYEQSGYEYSQSALDLNLNLSHPLGSCRLSYGVGLSDNEFTVGAGLRRSLGARMTVIAHLSSDYSRYPMIYDYYFKTVNPAEKLPKGFRYNLAQFATQFNTERLNSLTGVYWARSEFYIPTYDAAKDSLLSVDRETLNKFYIVENLEYTFPWKTVIRMNTIASLPQNKDITPQLQFWGRAMQVLDLFRGNLKLYAAADVVYHNGAENLVWFEGLRNFARTDAIYFTNQRLSANCRIGGHIGNFHIFYAIYNAEGRSFSSVAFMPYRNRLKVLGIEWSFLN